MCPTNWLFPPHTASKTTHHQALTSLPIYRLLIPYILDSSSLTHTNISLLTFIDLYYLSFHFMFLISTFLISQIYYYYFYIYCIRLFSKHYFITVSFTYLHRHTLILLFFTLQTLTFLLIKFTVLNFYFTIHNTSTSCRLTCFWKHRASTQTSKNKTSFFSTL